ncbi:MAG: nucleotidyl transferase AbiEii/AbiGii toxin family protein [Acidimicrobiia bacterium]
MFDRLVRVLDRLAAPEMPPVALIGGLAVNLRLSTAADAHRVTQDVDVVVEDTAPHAIEILAEDAEAVGTDTVVTEGVTIQVIETHPISAAELGELTDGDRLFVLAHRWALETATTVTVSTTGDAPQASIPVAVAAGLVATKSHAAGYPRQARRATKHGGDLYDVFRLVEVFDTRGELRDQIKSAPADLGGLVSDVVDAEILSDPGRAVRQMQSASSTVLDAQRVVDVMEPFVASLR